MYCQSPDRGQAVCLNLIGATKKTTTTKKDNLLIGGWPWCTSEKIKKNAATTSCMEIYLNKSHCREVTSNEQPSGGNGLQTKLKSATRSCCCIFFTPPPQSPDRGAVALRVSPGDRAQWLGAVPRMFLFNFTCDDVTLGILLGSLII